MSPETLAFCGALSTVPIPLPIPVQPDRAEWRHELIRPGPDDVPEWCRKLRAKMDANLVEWRIRPKGDRAFRRVADPDDKAGGLFVSTAHHVFSTACAASSDLMSISMKGVGRHRIPVFVAVGHVVSHALISSASASIFPASPSSLALCR
jgi:hypothetical protein